MADFGSTENHKIARDRKANDAEVLELLAFVCDREAYAVSLESVHEIVIPPPITYVPRSPHAVLGICSVRGELVTIVDLRRVLDLPQAVESNKNRILLARVNQNELLGLRVDEVRQVVRLTAAQIEYSTQSLGGDGGEGVRGVGRPTPKEVIVILDLKSVFERGCA